MTLCTPSPATNPIPQCTGSLIVGTVANLSATLNMYVKSITTGRIDKLTALSDPAGLVTVDISEYTGMIAHGYEFWLTEDDADMYAKIDITIGTITADTFALKFTDPFDGEGSLSVATQTLSLA